jgi:hypothetical protein
MMLESFGKEFPFWVAPLNTTLLLVFFLYLSLRELKKSSTPLGESKNEKNIL